MSETPIGDEVLGEEAAPDVETVEDDGTDEVTEDVVEPDLGEAPEAVDDPTEAAEGSDEDPDGDPGDPEPDEPPVVLETPYAIPGEEPAGWEPNATEADDA
jgi:hypothetical protein